jgi:O-acetyl-ADP-ribose deacetylase (regulator of RNase III)
LPGHLLVLGWLPGGLLAFGGWLPGGLLAFGWLPGGCEDGVMARIEIVVADITGEVVDAIVTAANESLLGGGGVDGAVHRAAGPRLAEAGAALAPLDPGDAVATPAFDLDPPVRHVIHTVGPVWEGGDHGEAEVLASCYRRSLEVADRIGARTVAFPAIATGVYGFPAERPSGHRGPHDSGHADGGGGGPAGRLRRGGGGDPRDGAGRSRRSLTARHPIKIGHGGGWWR